MAITSISASDRNVSEHIRYACDPGKTQEDVRVLLPSGEEAVRKKTWTTFLNCRRDTAAQQFNETRLFWERAKGGSGSAKTSCYYGFISFDRGEADAAKAHEIGVQLVKRLWGDGYEAVIATHLNTGYIHDHFVVNSVSWKDGDRRLGNRIWYPLFRIEADRICLEHGLSVMDENYRKRRTPAEYKAEKEGKPTLKSLIRQDIDRAVRCSLSMREFLSALEDMGYETDMESCKRKGRPALRPPGGMRFYSFRRLGRQYTAESISDRIMQRSARDIRPAQEIFGEAEKLRKELAGSGPAEGIAGLLRRYRCELEVLIRFPETVRTVPFPLREDIIRTGRTDLQIKFMQTNGLTYREDLQRFISSKKHVLEGLETERKSERNFQERCRRREDGEGAEKAKERIRTLSSDIRKVRKELETAEEILEREERMKENLISLRRENEKVREKEEAGNEQLLDRRGGPGREDDAGGN